MEPAQPPVPAAEDHITKMQDITHSLMTELQSAQEDYKHFADCHRAEPPAFSPGDKVWLLHRNIGTQHPCDKLDFKKLGPFTIVAEINSMAFWLNLPASMKIHDVFHVSLLEKYVPNIIPGRHVEPPPPVVVEGELEYEVDEVLDSRIFRGVLQYLVSWKGYNIGDHSWEPLENLSNCAESLEEFHNRYPHKPGGGGHS